jgi:phage/plasmid-like protein (TIGR03299 family)
MKLPNTLKFAGGQDNVELYILASNSHDSSTAFQLMVTPIRVVCANTLAMALGNHKRIINLKHTRNVKSRVTEARDALGLTFAYVEEFEKQVQQLINAPMTSSEFNSYIEKVYKVKNTTKKQETRTEKVQQEVRALWNAPTQENVKGTQWAAYNAVVEYVDWGMAMRLTKKISEDQARAIRTMTGGADLIKNRALKLLVK